MASAKGRRILFVSFAALIWLLVIALFILEIIGTPVKVSGRSMLPTFENGDIIYATKITDKTQLQSGDIVIAKFDGKLIVKRVSACPGDTVVENPQIPLGRKLDNNEYFIIGDNADESYDSRIFGAITRDTMLYKYAGFCIHRPDIWLVVFCSVTFVAGLTYCLVNKKRKTTLSKRAEDAASSEKENN